jgi:hypothetical protein
VENRPPGLQARVISLFSLIGAVNKGQN